MPAKSRFSLDGQGEVFFTSTAISPGDLKRTNALLTPAEADEQGVILRTTGELVD